MNEHAQIITIMRTHLEKMDSAVSIMPSALAWATFQEISNSEDNALLRYTSLEHLKGMARKVLANRFREDGEENEAHTLFEGADERFSGKLQERYPVPRANGEEPTYKLRIHLSPAERAWNVDQLRKSAGARLQHADALEAEGQMVGSAA